MSGLFYYVAFALLTALPSQSLDPNYAVDVRVLESDYNLVHNYRLVSLAWLEYLNGGRGADNVDVYYRVASVPDRLEIRTPLSRFNSKVYPVLDKSQLVANVFEQVFYSYLYDVLVLNRTVRLHRNTVDPTGVRLSHGRFFNRTFVITFEDPPYGQSRVNRLVTNRRIPFTVWQSRAPSHTLRFHRDYNMTRDLVYRYFHNVGHSLGFGHYLGSAINNMSVPFRSVMYANYMDARYSAPVPLFNDVDQRAMPLMLRNYRQLIREQVKRQNDEELAPALLTVVRAAARLA